MSVFSTVCCFVTLMLALSDLHLPAEGGVCIPQELADIYCGADYGETMIDIYIILINVNSQLCINKFVFIIFGVWTVGTLVDHVTTLNISLKNTIYIEFVFFNL